MSNVVRLPIIKRLRAAEVTLDELNEWADKNVSPTERAAITLRVAPLNPEHEFDYEPTCDFQVVREGGVLYVELVIGQWPTE